MRIARCGGTKHHRTKTMPMIDAQPLADTPTHRVPIRVSTRNTKLIKQRNRILSKPTRRIRRSAWLVTLTCSSVIIDDDTIAVREIVANPIPEGMIQPLTTDQQE